MSDTKPYKKFDKNKRFFEKTFSQNKKKVINSFNEVVRTFSDASKDIKFIPQKYNKFVEKVNNPKNKKLVKMIPAVLLGLTVLALKNKKLIEPMIKAFQVTAEAQDTNIAAGLVKVVMEYVGIIRKMNTLDSLDTSISTIIFILEEIPSVFKNANPDYNSSDLMTHKRIIRNINELNKDLVDLPKKKREEASERSKDKQEAIALKRHIAKFLKTYDENGPKLPDENKNPKKNGRKSVA